MALWSFDQLIARIWVALSTGVLIVFATASLTVVRQARLWTAAQLHGIPARDPAVWRLGLVLVALTPWEPHRVVAVAQAPFRDRKRL